MQKQRIESAASTRILAELPVSMRLDLRPV